MNKNELYDAIVSSIDNSIYSDLNKDICEGICEGINIPIKPTYFDFPTGDLEGNDLMNLIEKINCFHPSSINEIILDPVSFNKFNIKKITSNSGEVYGISVLIVDFFKDERCLIIFNKIKND